MHLTMRTQLVKFVKLAVMSIKFCYAMDVIRGIHLFLNKYLYNSQFFSAFILIVLILQLKRFPVEGGIVRIVNLSVAHK